MAKSPKSLAARTLEKDLDISGDRDATRGVERTAFSGSDRVTQGEANRAATSTDNKVDVSETEAISAGVARHNVSSGSIEQLALSQFLRQSEELHHQRITHAEELFSSRQRMRENASTFDKAVDEAYQAHAKSSNGQTIRNNDVGYNQLVNVDEQGYQVAQILRDMGSLGVDNRLTYSALLEAMSKILKDTVNAERA